MPALDVSRSACVVGWDIGGAHVKACLLRRGAVLDVMQWACPLWQGLDALDTVLTAARARWPEADAARHAVTMTGEMVDLFADREEGVRRIADRVARVFHDAWFYAGDEGWCAPGDVARRWQCIASANWLATALHVALAASAPSARQGDAEGGVLIDIGSTTTDLIAFRGGRVLTSARSDAERLASGELVYHGVVRTPLCALAPRIAWRGRPTNVMNEFFATTADVYRLSGELDPRHDLYPPADNADKDAAATRRRLARMIGMDARDAAANDWLGLALAWRASQVDELAGQLRRVRAAHGLSAAALLVSAGCGDFLARDVLTESQGAAFAGAIGDAAGVIDAGHRSDRQHRGGDDRDPSDPSRAGTTCVLHYGRDIAHVAADAPDGRDAVAARAQVGAPCVAVATLFDREYA